MKHFLSTLTVTLILATSGVALAQPTEISEKQALRETSLANRKIVRDAKAEMRAIERQLRKSN